MLLEKVTSLYEALDYESENGGQGTVRLYHRTEGADHAFELVWVLDDKASQTDYNNFAYHLSRIANRPGNKRQRLVTADESFLVDFPFRLGPDVGRHTWASLVNDLFHSDRFCDKVDIDYEQYKGALSQQMRSLSGNPECEYRYIDQSISYRSGPLVGSVGHEFFDTILHPTDDGKPLLALVQAPAGYGKTAFSYEIARLLAKEHRARPTGPFPVFVPFSKYRRFGGVRDILRAEIEELKLYGVNSQALLKMVHEGRAVVILDGFDELMAEVGKKSAKANLAAIAELLGGRARVALTTRSAFLSTSLEVADMMDSRVQEDGIKIFELVPFGESEVRTYLQHLSLPPDTIERAVGLIANHPDVHSLGRSPLMLNSIAAVAGQNYQESPSIYVLYDSHVDLLCERERERQKHDLTNGLQRRFLSGMAKSMYSDNTHLYDSDTLTLFWETEAKDLLLSAGYAPTDLDGLRTKLMCHALFDSAGASGDPIEGRRGIQFLHPSFRDFFVAKQVAELASQSAMRQGIGVARRPISDDLAEFVASRKDELSVVLGLFLQDRENGLRNALTILMASMDSGVVVPTEAEAFLRSSLGGKKVDGDLSGLRLEGLQFTGWEFGSSIFNDCHIVDCRFEDCQLEQATFFGALFSGSLLQLSRFGHAGGLNGIAVVEEGELERLFDNREIRTWLHGMGAVVDTDDLPLLQQQVLPETVGGEALLVHVFSKFFPTGSDSEQRTKKVSTFAKSLPPHRKEHVARALAWLRRRGVLVPGPVLSGSKNETLALAQDWRDDIRSLMKETRTSDRLRGLIADSAELVRGPAQKRS
jgi:hypothetical protein